eukprot:m.414845 g.414845  ORF g.414845 m.414845 type:complete len:56 (+) comp21275_c1_seq2:5487-5654(+)
MSDMLPSSVWTAAEKSGKGDIPPTYSVVDTAAGNDDEAESKEENATLRTSENLYA